MESGISTERLERTDIVRAAQFLKSGKVVAFPTETVYGLGAPIFNPKAIAHIFALKNRPSDNPLIAHISELKQMETIAIDIPELFFLLSDAFFPGPLTVVLKKHPRVPSIVSGNTDSIAVRMPKNPIANSLIDAVGEPLVAPSANLSGKPSATLCDHVLEDFEGKIVAVVDGGATEFGIESTVISLLHHPPMLLRPGTITKAQIEEVIGYSIHEADVLEQQSILSPGMKYRHYCPHTPISVFYSKDELLFAAQNEKYPLVLTRLETFSIPNGDHRSLLAKNLYAHLRFADATGCSRILILFDEFLLSDHALKNRLFRACGLSDTISKK